jgi:NAD(P)-dependent dehydrogenase (short-subunit alcohol dehydrogenase family)
MQEAMTYYMRTRLSFLGNWGQQACPRIGNNMGGAPTGLYRCLGGGPNDYVYLITVTQRHWDALCLAIERPDLVVDPRFETGENRMENGEALRQQVELWTEKMEKHEAMHTLCKAGVPSSAILDTQELYTDPHLVERGFGRVITISSGAGQIGLPMGISLYGAGKGGALAFMRHLAMEVAHQGVTANSLALGLMDHVGDADSVAAMARTVPVGRLGSPEDVGAAVTYLASNEASWLTGQTVGLNGGSTTS